LNLYASEKAAIALKNMIKGKAPSNRKIITDISEALIRETGTIIFLVLSWVERIYL